MRVQVGDVRLFVDVDGAKLRPQGPWLDERPTVVVVHTGPGVDHLPYKNHVGPALAPVAQVLYVDLRGHGRSDAGAPETWTVDTWTSDLVALLDTLGVERPVVLGAGWGAFTAIRLAALHPKLPSKLVLANPNARFLAARSVAAFDELANAEAGEAAFNFFSDPNDQTLGPYLQLSFPYVMGAPAATDALVRPDWNFTLALAWSRGEMRTIDLREDLAAITVPTLVVAGDSDPQYPRASIEEVVDGLREAHVEWFPGARHSVWRDAPQSLTMTREFVAAL
jgi:pimeloyl-ACP methyl ester carboxylesterase